eukprot:15365351-Ditylum_brightwellii.AAC.1
MPQVSLEISIDGEDKQLNELTESGYPEYVGYAENNEGSLRGIRLFGHEEVTYSFDSGYPATTETVLEFTFTLEETQTERHAICLQGINRRYCFDLRGSSDQLSNDNLERNTLGNIAFDNVESSYRIQLDKVLEDDSDTLSSISFLQQNLITLREGKSLFENVLLYSFKKVTVEKNLLGSVTLSVADVDSTIQFKPEVLLQDPSGSYSRVTVAERKILPTNAAVINNLIPGRRYVITLKPVTNSGDPVDRSLQNNKARATLITSCSCQESLTDVSGSPRNIVVSQSGGKVRVQFIDTSVCEEAFALSRREGNNTEDSYAPNYFFYSADQCSEEKIIPGEGFEDNIGLSALPVGNPYDYCVRAVGKNYIVNKDSSSGEFLTSSVAKCERHFVKWEATALVK